MNVWQKFWKSIGLPQNSSWEKACSKIKNNKKIPFALKFIAMAYADSQSKGKSSREAMEEIAHTLGFSYATLYTADSSFENDFVYFMILAFAKSERSGCVTGISR